MRRRIAVAVIVVNLIMTIASGVLWAVAAMAGWLNSVAFVAHVSMLALVFAAVTGIGGSLAALFAEDGTEGS